MRQGESSGEGSYGRIDQAGDPGGNQSAGADGGGLKTVAEVGGQTGDGGRQQAGDRPVGVGAKGKGYGVAGGETIGDRLRRPGFELEAARGGGRIQGKGRGADRVEEILGAAHHQAGGRSGDWGDRDLGVADVRRPVGQFNPGAAGVDGKEDVDVGGSKGGGAGAGNVPTDSSGLTGKQAVAVAGVQDGEGALGSVYRQRQVALPGAAVVGVDGLDGEAEVHRPVNGGEDLPLGSVAGQDVGQGREEAGGIPAGGVAAKQGPLGVLRLRWHVALLGVVLVPAVGDGRAGEGRRVQAEGGSRRNGSVGGQTHAGVAQTAVDDRSAAATEEIVLHEKGDFLDAPPVKIGVAVQLDVRRADTGVAHDRTAATGLHTGGGAVVAVIVLGVESAQLVPKLVGHVVDGESIPLGQQ